MGIQNIPTEPRRLRRETIKHYFILLISFRGQYNTNGHRINLLYQIIYWIQNLATNAISFGSYTIQNTTYLRHPKIIILQVQMSLRMIKKGLLFYAEFLQ